jgi:hypothetical protein
MKTFLFLILFSNLFLIHCSNKKDSKKGLLNNILNGWSEQFFMRSSESGSANNGNDAETLLKQVLQSGSKKIYCSFEDINLLGVVDVLREAMSKKIDVRIGIDEDNREQIGYRLLSEFLSTRGEGRRLWIGNKGEAQVYMNICVVDDKRVFLSTAPPTLQGFYNESSFYFYIQGPEDGIVKKFGQTMDLITNGAFGSSKQKLNQRNHFLIQNADIGIYFAPEEKPIDFIQKRVTAAKNSVQIYSTEFYSNKVDSDFSVRTFTDIAYELVSNPSISKQIIGSYSAINSIDPTADGDCDMNSYIGLTCDATKPTGTSSNNPRGLNSLLYLKKNAINPFILGSDWPGNGLNLTLIDSGSNAPMAFISSHPYSSRASSSHDGTMIVLEDKGLVAQVKSFYDRLTSRSVNNISDTGEASKYLDIVISELNWMGGFKQGKINDFEYLELYNNTNQTVNISGWKFQCGVNGVFTTIFTLPIKTIIGPNQYFLIVDSASTMVDKAHLKLNWGGGDKIENSFTDQCQILNNGNISIDIAGEIGIPFLLNSLKTGFINIDAKQIRSMERNNLQSAGNTIQNWHTNSNNSYRNNVNIQAQHLDGTFGTPGYRNSGILDLPPYNRNPARALVINEVGIDDPNSNDQWVEIFNPTESEIDLIANNVFLRRDSSCNISDGSWTTTIPLTGKIPAKGYYLVTRSTATSTILNLANQIDFGTISTSNCIALTLTDEVEKTSRGVFIVDFVNIGGAGDRENNSFITPTSNSSFSRCKNGVDTNFNAVDFRKKGSSPKQENPCPATPTSLLVNEWSDGATDFDFIELKNFGTSSIIIDKDLSIEYGPAFSRSDAIFKYADTSNTFGNLPTGGVTVSPNEIVLVCESDCNIAGLRALLNFTGKIFSINQTSLMTTGSNQLIRQNPARLSQDGQTWSITPNLSTFSLGTAFLKGNFQFGADSTNDPSKWNETATGTATPGFNNP